MVIVLIQVIAKSIECPIVLIEHYLRLLIVVAMRVVVLKLRRYLHISVDVRISHVLVFFSHIVLLL